MSTIACYTLLPYLCSEGQRCCYDKAGGINIGQPGGGGMDKFSPLVDFDQHSLNDLLPYALCCRGGAMMCHLYESLRPSNYIPAGQEYQLPTSNN